MYKQSISIDQKKEVLENAISQLKKEFVGINDIIDEVGDLMMSWWIFPEHQFRPLIINLWGMTGSGKTAFIKRLVELMDYSKYSFRFDMGAFGNHTSYLKTILTTNLSSHDNQNPVIILDEFQFAKTKDENGKEVNNNGLRMIWDLLDSGIIHYEPIENIYQLTKGRKMMLILKSLEKEGVQIKKGVLQNNISRVERIIKSSHFGYEDHSVDRSDGKKPYPPENIFISDIFGNGVFDLSEEMFGHYGEVAAQISKMNSLNEIIELIENILEITFAQREMDLTKSIIFVLGNIDEAYEMSDHINPDIDADEYRRFTLKINIADIKKALQSRFRNEQIARLGNNHLIYYAFSNKNFEQLISLNLKRLKALVKSKFKLKVTFTKKVNQLIYAEGVFPTHGVRPVLSTITNYIETNITKVIYERNTVQPKTDHILWDFVDDHFDIKFYKDKNQVHTLSLPVIQKINSLRKSTHDDQQAMVAVHESGHAVIAMMMVHVIPEYVITRTVDSDSAGFTYTVLPDDIVTKRLMLDRMRLLLGGYVAETLTFGEENNTTGVSDDLKKVTQLAHSMVREYGMTGLTYKSNIHVYGGNPAQFTFGSDDEITAKEIINQCLEEVKECMTEHKQFLLLMSNYLANNNKIIKSDLKKMYLGYQKKNKLKKINFLDKNSYYDFKKKLESQ